MFLNERTISPAKCLGIVGSQRVTPRLSISFNAYLEAFKNQYTKHGFGALKAKSKQFYFGNDLSFVGFESPDGWFVISIRNLKKAFVCNESENELTDKQIVENYKLQIQKAISI